MFRGSPTHHEYHVCSPGKYADTVDADSRVPPERVLTDTQQAACEACSVDSVVDSVGVPGWVGGAEVDLAELRDSELKDRIVDLVAERSRVEGLYLAALGEFSSRCGPQAAAHCLRDLTRMNGPQARSEARLADSLVTEGFSDTVEAMQRGEVQMSHARVVAREAPKKHRRSEEEFLYLSRLYPSDTIARHPFAYHSLQVEADLAAEAAAAGLSPLDAEVALQRQQRSASLRRGDDGLWHLRGVFDHVTGRQLSSTLQAAIRSLRNRHSSTPDTAHDAHAARPAADPSDANSPAADDADLSAAAGPTRAHLAADALCELMLGPRRARSAATSLVIVADYDAVHDRLGNPRLDDGTPLSARQLAEQALDANVLPAVFSADWSQLALGRTRNASDAQRLVLAVRDGGCIGCDLTAEHTQAHHIDYYEHGGRTDLPNLASLCEPCHISLHQYRRSIAPGPDGCPRLLPPGTSDPRPADRSRSRDPAEPTPKSSPPACRPASAAGRSRRDQSPDATPTTARSP